MNIVFFILFLCIFLYRIITDLLFFQQNSYKNNIHSKWIINHKKRYFFSILLLLYGLVIIFKQTANLFSIILLLLTIVNIIPKEKPIKPLVWTNRAIRLFITSLILVILLCLFVKTPLIFILYLFSPYLLIISNIVNSPIEKSINNIYIKQAKEKIKNHENLIVIGITGSYGKTSVKNYLGELLGEKYNVLITPKNYNTTMGVVKSIRENLKSTHEIFICEMGATQKGDIREICEIIKPIRLGIITGIAPIHFETFLNMNNLISTKFELVNYCEKFYYNFDNNELKNAINKYSAKGSFANKIIKSYSLNNVKNIKMNTFGTEFILDNSEYKTSLIGNANLENLIGCIMISKNEFNVSNTQIDNALTAIKSVNHRQELKIIDSKTNIIDDSYNSNPIGSFAALKTLKMFENDYKILITPGMIDLGNKQESANYEFGVNASKIADEIILVDNISIKPIIKSLNDNNFTNYKIYNTMKLAIDYAISFNAKKHKTILIENDLPDKYL